MGAMLEAVGPENPSQPYSGRFAHMAGSVGPHTTERRPPPVARSTGRWDGR